MLQVSTTRSTRSPVFLRQSHPQGEGPGLDGEELTTDGWMDTPFLIPSHFRKCSVLVMTFAAMHLACCKTRLLSFGGAVDRVADSKHLLVMLLGQAESGKSTLQKQFQLYYASQSLDQERPAWRPVVYFNVIKAIRTILEELDYELASSRPALPPLPTVRHRMPFSGSGQSTWVINEAESPGAKDNGKSPVWTWTDDLSHLRAKLLPLIAAEDTLATELSGGVIVAGGRAGVYVRAGWQSLMSPNANRGWSASNAGKQTPANDSVARTLSSVSEDISRLWRHPTVRSLIKHRKLRLEESASL